MRRLKVFAVVLLLALPVPATMASAPAPLDRSAIIQFERKAEQVVSRSRIPGLAMAIVDRGRVVSVRGYGVTDTRSRQAANADTVYRVASLSKAFAATLSAQLVREGALTWDSPIANQLPAFRLKDADAAQRLTVRDILSHKVGLAHNTLDRDLEAEQPYPLLASRLADAPLACTPGECYGYQNIAFSLIGDLVFAVTGNFYSQQVEKRLFHPLGMYGATFGRDGLESSTNWARPHIRSRGLWQPVRAKETYYRVPPAAGVNASARDMAQWLLAQLGHFPEVLPHDLLAEIQSPLVPTPGEIRGRGWRGERLRDASYALGWRVFDYAGHKMVFHGGAVQGYRAMIALLPERDLGIVVLWNSESAAPSGLLPTITDRALGLPARDWLKR
ncbi:MAG TPA: serine hydrolase domain-containing protein [Arenimonas sp.]|nr:serine hydrolase domain-containing protein [Arenimonas sp.]